MKKKVFIFGEFSSSEINLKKWKKRKIYNHEEFSNLYSKLLWRNFDDKSHYWIGENELGLEFKRIPSELREIFGWTPKNFIKGHLISLKSKFETAVDSIKVKKCA